jgi:hypothetical protein
MQHNRKALFILSFVISFAFLAKKSFAQYPGMGAVYRQMNNQFVNQQMNSMMMQIANMRGVQGTIQEYDFIVTLRDSTTEKVRSAIYTDSATKKSFIVLVNKKYIKLDTNRFKRIYAAQTLSLVCVLKERSTEYETPGVYLPGNPTDTCWMFKSISGRLSAYSSVIYDGLDTINPSMIVGIQLKDGPILKFNVENLKIMVGQDLNALKFIENKNYVRAIKKYNRDNDNEPEK